MRFRKIGFAIALTLTFSGINARAANGETPSFTPPNYEYESLSEQSIPADYWQQVGANAVIVGDYPNALAALSKAIDLTDAQTPNLLEQRAWVHYRLGHEHLASSDFRTAAALYLVEERYDDYINARSMLQFIDS